MNTPTNVLIDGYIEKFNNDERYYPADQAITKLFQTFPANVHLEDILLKISVLNDLYSTNILGTFAMAKHIQKLGIDISLDDGDPHIVNKISVGHGIRSSKTTKELNFYSFATKYCNWHNREQYAIYDSFVEKILMAYKKQDNFSMFTKAELRDFPTFKRVIQDFIEFYDLNRHNLKEIDKFLWIYGKEMFPVKYY
jgi:hypothetical protein